MNIFISNFEKILIKLPKRDIWLSVPVGILGTPGLDRLNLDCHLRHIPYQSWQLLGMLRLHITEHKKVHEEVAPKELFIPTKPW